MKIKRILAKRICLIAGTVLSVVIGGQLSAQTMIAKKAKVYAVADAHLDTQWNWDIQTTIKEYIWNTLNQNLFLLNRYPNYIFNFEGGVKYAWMKEYYPREYELMKAFVKAGAELVGMQPIPWFLLLSHLFVILCWGRNFIVKS